MTPADYLRAIVLPSLAEMLAEPSSSRRAYVACITAAHLVDHVAAARGIGGHRKHEVREAVRALGPRAAACLAIVEGVCTGVKHAAPDPKPNRPVKFVPGDERAVPAFAFSVEGAGWGQGRFGGPGVAVEHDGMLWFLDTCVLEVVRAYAQAFPAELGGVDLAPILRSLAHLTAPTGAPEGEP